MLGRGVAPALSLFAPDKEEYVTMLGEQKKISP